MRINHTMASSELTHWIQLPFFYADNLSAPVSRNDKVQVAVFSECMTEWYRNLWLKCYLLCSLAHNSVPFDDSVWSIVLGELADAKRTMEDSAEEHEATAMLLDDDSLQETSTAGPQTDVFTTLLDPVEALINIASLYHGKA